MKRVDSLLLSVERLLSDNSTPFDREQADLSREVASSIRELVLILRSRMLEALSALEVALPEKDQSARWTIEATLHLADVALSDLGGRRLQGYGELEPAAADQVARISVELRQIVQEGIFLLHSHS